jgi:hypothetical protein
MEIVLYFSCTQSNDTEKATIMVWRVVKVLEFVCEYCYRCFTEEKGAIAHEQQCKNMHCVARLTVPSIVADGDVADVDAMSATTDSNNSQVIEELADEDTSLMSPFEDANQTHDHSMAITIEEPQAEVVQGDVPIADNPTSTPVQAESTNSEDTVEVSAKSTNANKPFVCRACDAAFDNRPEMAKHKRQPHKCSHCERLLANATSLLGHVETLHEHRKPYACVTCYERFSTTSQVKCSTLEDFTLNILFAYFSFLKQYLCNKKHEVLPITIV